MRAAVDFARSPLVVVWEVTRACALARVHRRADTVAPHDPRELTTREGFRLIDEILALGAPPPLLILTGGDPTRRKDLAELVRYASRAGLIVALTPGGTAAAMPARIVELEAAGLSRIDVSLDGPDRESHDRFRRVNGSYAWTMRLIQCAVDRGLPLQINSTISRATLPHLRALARTLSGFPIESWSLCFLVQTGGGAGRDQIAADQCERVLEYVHDLSLTARFSIETTEAPQYRRVIWQQDPLRGAAGVSAAGVAAPPQPRAPGSAGGGNGLVFVDHVGNICPSGFLPLPRGNVREVGLGRVYRDDPVFRRLRAPDMLLGKCRRCEFRVICGGSRARAYAATGSFVASDPLCAYEPGPDVMPPVTAQD
jgi:radical SAM protein